jgi:hypothetical protein
MVKLSLCTHDKFLVQYSHSEKAADNTRRQWGGGVTAAAQFRAHSPPSDLTWLAYAYLPFQASQPPTLSGSTVQ